MKRRRVVVMVLAAVVLIAGAVLLIAVLLLRDDGGHYSPEVEAAFLAACTADGGEETEPACRCLYGGLVETVPFERFQEIDDALAQQRADDPSGELDLPDDVQVLLDRCLAGDS